MPISGFHVGDRVVTPAGHKATVVNVDRRGAETVVVRYDDHPERHPKVQTFRSGALRWAQATNREGRS